MRLVLAPVTATFRCLHCALYLLPSVLDTVFDGMRLVPPPMPARLNKRISVAACHQVPHLLARQVCLARNVVGQPLHGHFVGCGGCMDNIMQKAVPRSHHGTPGLHWPKSSIACVQQHVPTAWCRQQPSARQAGKRMSPALSDCSTTRRAANAPTACSPVKRCTCTRQTGHRQAISSCSPSKAAVRHVITATSSQPLAALATGASVCATKQLASCTRTLLCTHKPAVGR